MMGRLFSKWSALAAVAILVAVQAAAVSYLGSNNYLPEGSEHWTEDWLIHYFSKHLDRTYKDIAIVIVDAESLEKSNVPATVPVDRGWMAKLITAVSEQEPLAIGLDAAHGMRLEARHAVGQQAQALHHVVADERTIDVELEIAVRATDVDRDVVAHHLRGQHRQRFALRGVHFARHDG